MCVTNRAWEGGWDCLFMSGVEQDPTATKGSAYAVPFWHSFTWGMVEVTWGGHGEVVAQISRLSVRPEALDSLCACS